MSEARSRSRRLNYQTFNESGERVDQSTSSNEQDAVHEITPSNSDDPAMSNVSSEAINLETDIIVGIEEVQDVIDEHQIYGAPEDDTREVVQKLSALRVSLRKKIVQLGNLNPEAKQNHEPALTQTFDQIKDFIKTANDYKVKSTLRTVKIDEDKQLNLQKSMIFTADDINVNLSQLESIFTADISTCDDRHLILLKSELPEHEKSLRMIADRYEQLLKTPTNNEKLLGAINDIDRRYSKLNKMKVTYGISIQQLIDHREVDKYQTFNELRLNINLKKFSGYDSPSDIYTFRSDFEKLYLRSTPQKLLPDLLINNFLSEPALSLVKGITDIKVIWKRLQDAFGNTKILLSKKLSELNKMESTAKSKDATKVMSAVTQLINIIKDLMRLAEEHNIENQLYYGNGLDQIYKLMGDSRVTRWLSATCDEDLDEKEKWERLVTFLNKEAKVQQQKALMQGNTSTSRPNEGSKDRPTKYQRPGMHFTNQPSNNPVCYFCDGDCPDEHIPTRGPGGGMLIQYFSCKSFADKSPRERFAIIKRKGLCFQCLFPGAKQSEGKHKDGRCQHDFTCKHESHQQWQIKKHILVCEDHKSTEENQKLLEAYKSRCMKNPNLPSFSRNLKLSIFVNDQASSNTGIYLLQRVKIHNEVFTVFFDNGCSDFVIRNDAVRRLGPYATKLFDGSVSIGGVGGMSTESNNGIYAVNIPLFDGKLASMSGICLDRITQTFPVYQLKEAEMAIKNAIGDSIPNLPEVSTTIGGDIDIMIGVKYLCYHPKLVFQMNSGLSLFESVFSGPDGRGVIGGPHRSFKDAHQKHHNTLFSEPRATSTCYHGLPKLLGFNSEENHQEVLSESYTTDIHHNKCLKQFETTEHTGSEIAYRCIDCRQCKRCKDHDKIENISIKEEVEQDLINNSITFNSETKTIMAKLPFIHNPLIKLAPNRDRALKIYQQQLRKLNLEANLNDKEDIIKSESKLHELGYVDYVSNLPEATQMKLQSQMKHYIPWRAVWKTSSISTPCRIVYDASHATSTGNSLNDILAKGRNNLNKLQDIALRWGIHRFGFTTDIRKMYNTIHLDEDHWCYQRYLWEPNLDPSRPPQEKVIKTLIYGVRSSGNQAECGLRKMASNSRNEFPEACKIIEEDMFVDDCVSGDETHNLVIRRSDELEIVVNKGGFQLKGIAVTGEDPPESLSDDQKSLSVAGMRWFPKEDMLSLNISELNFSKKLRGKKSSNSENIIPTKLTRRHCASKVGEIFDLLGKVTPLTASFKLDLHELVLRKLDWDDTIPEELRPIWISNFELMQEINNLQFKRTIVPDDAVNLELTTLDFADASQSLICVAIYARFKRRCGDFSCQLVLSRSRIVPQGMSQPRAELYAALLNAHTGEIVRRSFRNWHQSSIKLTDSQITLHWINNDTKPLKQWVRNRIVEVLRFTNKDQWYYVRSNNMIADIGTRRGAKLEDVNQHSNWFNGFEWMKLELSDMPIFTLSEVKMSPVEESELKHEVIPSATLHQAITKVDQSTQHTSTKVANEINRRLHFSDYLINPNRHSFTTVVRIMGIVMRFCNILLKRAIIKSAISPEDFNQPQILLTEEELTTAKNYFYRKCTLEFKHFSQPKKYKDVTIEKDGIVYYIGRILDTDDITIAGRFNNLMKDLSMSTFCVPIVDKYSPVAYSIINDIHWNHSSANHAGVETTLRHVCKVAYIIEGRALVKMIRKLCPRCRYLMKKTVDVAMGPVSKHSLMIAPAFYSTQVDLCGSFDSYSPQHKRTTVKIWLLVFCCSTTSTTNIKVMEDYSTQSFIQGFIRFSCEVGYPKVMLCDAGSQLVRGCQDMRFSFRDIKYRLHKDTQIEFEVCPVGGHNEHGKVERKIKEIKSSIQKILQNDRLSILQWETLAASIANSINNMPLAIGGTVSDLENLDIITPNRLKLGRNNDRSPTEPVQVEGKPIKIIRENEKLFNAWFENWLLFHVPKLIRQQKWYESDDKVSIGDIVLFLKNESKLCSDYQYGMVVDVEVGHDESIRRVIIRYRNSNEEIFRETRRSVRTIVIIKRVDEIDILDQIN